MIRTNRLPVIILAVVLLLLILFVPTFGWHVRAFFSADHPTVSANENLAIQNDALKAQLGQYQTIATELPQSSPQYIRAMVYSRYPMNFRNEFLVNAGANDGIVPGKAVVIEASSSYMLVGKIETVFGNSSLVETVFDSSFKAPVRIGSHGYDALFEGGISPEANSIVKSAAVVPGDVIYAADPSLPYGIAIAQVANVAISPDNLFEVAQLVFPYDLSDVQTVLIEK